MKIFLIVVLVYIVVNQLLVEVFTPKLMRRNIEKEKRRQLSSENYTEIEEYQDSIIGAGEGYKVFSVIPYQYLEFARINGAILNVYQQGDKYIYINPSVDKDIRNILIGHEFYHSILMDTGNHMTFKGLCTEIRCDLYGSRGASKMQVLKYCKNLITTTYQDAVKGPVKFVTCLLFNNIVALADPFIRSLVLLLIR